MDFDEDSLLLLLAACILCHVPEIIHQLLLLLLLSCVLIHEIQYSLQLADTLVQKKSLSANWRCPPFGKFSNIGLNFKNNTFFYI